MTGSLWKGHILWFEPKPLEPWSAASGLRLLLILGAVEGILGPRMGLLHWFGLDAPPAWFRVPVLIAVVLGLSRWWAGVRPSQLGFRSWAVWSQTERFYFFQVLVIANVIFASLLAKPLRVLIDTPAVWGQAVVVLITTLSWGLYQELIYRGILQSELCRRWGAAGPRLTGVAAVLVANTLYTFGPLHFYHFANRTPASAAAMFGAIFAIGLFFGLLFHRSHNLWMVGLFHGLGDWYLVGVRSLVD